MIHNLIIMAAGRSTRMWPLTEYVPKAMALADNKTLLQINVEKYLPLGLKIHLTVGYKSDVLSPYALGLGVDSLINTNGRGNSWWLFNTLLSKIDEPVMVITCDSLMDVNMDRLENNYEAFGRPACMVLPAKVREGFEGDCIHLDGQRVTKLSRQEKTNLYCSGCQVMNPKKITELIKPADDFLDVWGQLMALQQLYCADFTAENWYTFDSVDQLKLYRDSKK